MSDDESTGICRGDALLQLYLTLIIADELPALDCGSSTHLRDGYVSNKVLEALFVHCCPLMGAAAALGPTANVTAIEALIDACHTLYGAHATRQVVASLIAQLDPLVPAIGVFNCALKTKVKTP
jgi:dsRNA-specific ribonuclease